LAPSPTLSICCSFGEDCANFLSWKCQFCRTTYARDPKESLLKIQQDLPGQTVHYRCFKDRKYYHKTLPFIEVKWLFEKEKKGA